MPMNEHVKRLAELTRQRATLRARLAKVTNDLAENDIEMKKVAAQLTDDQTAPGTK